MVCSVCKDKDKLDFNLKMCESCWNRSKETLNTKPNNYWKFGAGFSLCAFAIIYMAIGLIMWNWQVIWCFFWQFLAGAYFIYRSKMNPFEGVF